jgi:hypothetical protein
MSEYINGQRTPEPGRFSGDVKPSRNSKSKIVKKEVQEVDVNAIAAAVVKAMGRINVGSIDKVAIDDFDNSASLERLAKAMIGQTGSKGNLDGIGVIKETKKDNKETSDTIDLLSKMGD